MNKQELIEKLNKLNVPKYAYSLDGTLLPDAIIIYENYGTWEVFYLDERGGRHDLKKFNSNIDAYEYVYQHLAQDFRNTKLNRPNIKL